MNIPIEPRQLQNFSKLGRFGCIFEIVREWILIGAAICIAQTWSHPVITILAVIWIGARQHALGTLVHDAAHWRLHNNRKINDLLGNVFCAWPIFLQMKTYRHVHLLHHRLVGTPQDPELVSDRHPKSRAELFRGLAFDICGLNILKQLKRSAQLSRMAPQKETFRVLFYLAIFGLLIATHGIQIFLIYWLLPIFTYLRFVVQLRSIADHAGLEGRHPVRTLVPSIAEKWLIAPRNVSYHFAHHLYMSVPSVNLPKLHEVLLANAEYSQCVTKGFIALTKEFENPSTTA